MKIARDLAYVAGYGFVVFTVCALIGKPLWIWAKFLWNLY